MVVNILRPNTRYDVFIGRPGIWGNPFVIGRDGTRAEVIAKHRAWLLTQDHLMARIQELSGKVLGCYCKPMACHGDTLAEIASRHAAAAEWLK